MGPRFGLRPLDPNVRVGSEADVTHRSCLRLLFPRKQTLVGRSLPSATGQEVTSKTFAGSVRLASVSKRRLCYSEVSLQTRISES